MSKPKNQHIIPKVYLKQFHIGDNSRVYCLELNNPYQKNVQIVGTNDNKFKVRNFYTDTRLENIYAIENFFSRKIETPWPSVLRDITNKRPLSKESKIVLINWIYASAFRNPTGRKNYQRILEHTAKIIASYKKESINEEELKIFAKHEAKNMQLNAFVDPEKSKELHNMFEKGLANKTWKILEAPRGYYFLTNDKPCFSPNLHPYHQKHFPFHFNPEINYQSQIYFILNPKFCLEITPFLVGTPLDANVWNMTPMYEVITPIGVGLVNRGVTMTADKFLISNSYELLEQTRINLQAN